MPETLQAAVLSRLGRAGPELEELLRAGAVLGAGGRPGRRRRAAGRAPARGRPPLRAGRGDPPAGAGRPDLRVRQRPRPGGAVRHHPAPTRAVHHRRAADLLVAPPEAVGRHAAAVEDWPRAARAWLLAGERTRRRSAADAVALLDRALDAARRGDEPELVGRALIARGRAREALERYADALDDHRAALAAAREAGDRRLEMVALRELGGDAVVGAGSPVAECVPPLRSCLRIAAVLGDRAAEADALARLAVLATHRLSFAEAWTTGAAPPRPVAPRARTPRWSSASTASRPPTPTSARSPGCATSSRSWSRSPGGPATSSACTGCCSRARWRRSRRPTGPRRGSGSRRRSTRNRRSGYAAHEVWMLRAPGLGRAPAGAAREAVEHGRRAVALGDRAGHHWWRPAARAFLAGTLVECGAAAEAVGLLAEVVAEARQDGAEAHRLRCLAPLAEATGTGDVLAEADALLRGSTRRRAGHG